MYCPGCANKVKDGLKYCNNCGAKLGAEIGDNSAAEMLDGLLETIFWTAGVGLGILVGLVSVMLYNKVQSELAAIVSIFYLATVGMIRFMLARQVPKLIDAKLKSTQSTDEVSSPAQLRSPTTAQLEEPREPATSVTEHTTRTLDKVPR